MPNQTRTIYFLAILWSVFFCMASETRATELLLSFDGTGSTFVDSSGNNHQVTLVGSGVTQSTAESVRGGSSAFFNGNGHLEILHPTDFLFAPGVDYTIDFWVNSTNLNRSHALSFGNGFSDNIDFDFNDGFGFWVYHRSTGANNIRHSDVGAFTDGEWHHVAVVRENGVITNYMNGVDMGTLAMNVELGSNKVIVGATFTGGLKWQGFIDEVRIVNGEALFTENFNPLTFNGSVPEFSSFYLVFLGLFVLIRHGKGTSAS